MANSSSNGPQNSRGIDFGTIRAASAPIFASPLGLDYRVSLGRLKALPQNFPHIAVGATDLLGNLLRCGLGPVDANRQDGFALCPFGPALTAVGHASHAGR